MNVGVFGGTFDPIHAGHVTAAEVVADEFKLSKVLFIPAGRPPHRDSSTDANYEQRYRMVQLAIKQDARFVASRLEDPDVRSGLHFSIDTLELLSGNLTVKDRVFFLIGADAFAEIRNWFRWHDVIEMVEFIVISRAGKTSFRSEPPEGTRAHWLDSVDIPISSTDIRRCLKTGKCKKGKLVPEVHDYICQNGLYGT